MQGQSTIIANMGFSDENKFFEFLETKARIASSAIPKNEREEFKGRCRIAVVKSMPNFDPHKGTGRAYITRIVSNQLKQYFRDRRKRRSEFELASVQEPSTDDRPGLSPEEAFANTELCAIALSVLDAEDRNIVIFKIWGAMTWESIAKLMSLPRTTVQSRAKCAYEKMRERIIRELGE